MQVATAAIDALPNVHDIRDQLEGPKPLRAIAAVAGLAMTAVAVMDLLNPLFANPFDYIVKAYMAVFGLVVVIVESKSTGSPNALKNFIYKWAPFTSIVGGKGIMYFFFGTWGISFGWRQPFLFASGCATALVGVAYILIHFFQVDSLATKYDQSVYYAAKENPF